MYKVVIVDDEQIICDGIAQAVDWDKFHCTVVGKANDGITGLGLIRREKSDIAFLDIKMPLLTGIQIVEKAFEENLPVKFIILSGHANFNYAKECMKYGVRHYLIKPAGINEIEEALLDCIKELPQKHGKEYYSRSTRIAIKFIEDNLSSSELTLGFLSGDVLNMNVDYFSRLFRRDTGRHFTEYVLERRIAQAKELLETTNLKIYEVARRIGFIYNEQYFGQIFKRATGMTPQEYRNTNWKMP